MIWAAVEKCVCRLPRAVTRVLALFSNVWRTCRQRRRVLLTSEKKSCGVDKGSGILFSELQTKLTERNERTHNFT